MSEYHVCNFRGMGRCGYCNQKQLCMDCQGSKWQANCDVCEMHFVCNDCHSLFPNCEDCGNTMCPDCREDGGDGLCVSCYDKIYGSESDKDD
jgi:hypothetical protein